MSQGNLGTPSRSMGNAPDHCCRVNVNEDERWVSLLAGGALTGLGLLRGGMSGLLTLGAGAGLLYRGMTGHCHLYEALGVNTADKNHETSGHRSTADQAISEAM